MFHHILVPLDGSSRAEEALPVAARIVRASGGKLTVLRVLPPLELGVYPLQSTMPPELPLKADIAEANAYLAQVTSSDDLTGIDIRTEVLTGAPAQTIVLFEQVQHIDLTVMCSHGFTGFKRWWFGSVAQHVVRHSPAPVLVLREGGLMLPARREGLSHSVRVLVALDGSVLAETALVPAAHLSAILSAPAAGVLHLVRVLPLPELVDDCQKEILLPARKLAASEVAAYLDAVKHRLQEGDLAKLALMVTSSVVVHTDVADTLIWEAEHGEFVGDSAVGDGPDLIAMATHGRGGPQRWFLGSMTERVLGATRLPLLIVRSHLPQLEEQTRVTAMAMAGKE